MNKGQIYLNHISKIFCIIRIDLKNIGHQVSMGSSSDEQKLNCTAFNANFKNETFLDLGSRQRIVCWCILHNFVVQLKIKNKYYNMRKIPKTGWHVKVKKLK